jgi:hypothetical protein
MQSGTKRVPLVTQRDVCMPALEREQAEARIRQVVLCVGIETVNARIDRRRHFFVGFVSAQPEQQSGGAGQDPLCVPKTSSELIMCCLNWQNDRATLFRTGRSDRAIQVEVAA